MTSYVYCSEEQAPERVRDADVIVVNKVKVNEQTVGGASRLKLVCVTATGTDNLDKDYLKRRGIAWRNVAGYSTESVAQHTFALALCLMQKMYYYDQYVKTERYISDRSFTHFAETFHELCGMTWGIIGLGSIGRRVADIAGAFGCRVIYYSASGSSPQTGYEQVDFATLLETSDIVSVHAPLSEHTRNLMDKDAFAKMKRSAIFVNVGRGQIVVEEDLADAIENGEIAAAGLDVLQHEPMRADNPLRRIKDSTRLVITPHIAWAALEARTRLMEIICRQIREYFGM